MNDLQLFLPCAAGVESHLAQEVQRIVLAPAQAVRTGVRVQGSWRDALQLNLHSRLAQRVLVQLACQAYRTENDLYDAASDVPWEMWFTPKQSFKIDITAQHSPLTSLNFAALKVKDAVADRFRRKTGIRPDVNTHWPDVRIFVHLTTDAVSMYIDTSGEPLFKRGWREDKGDAPLKETLAAAMLHAVGWDPMQAEQCPVYDPCCGSGTIVIEAAQMALGIPAGGQRQFGFEKLLAFQPHVWHGLRDQALAQVRPAHAVTQPLVFGSDVSHRMVDFAQRNALRAGVAHVVELRGGDALQRMPPSERKGIMLLNPPYGERIAAAGVAGDRAHNRVQQHRLDERAPRVHRLGVALQPEGMGREQAQTDAGGHDFFPKLATHWKHHFAGWTAWLLTPDMKLPSRMRFKESRRIPMWNGPIECRLFRFDLMAGSARATPNAGTTAPAEPDGA